jgi:sigma-E factor negative regulatory protein RseC
MLVKPATLIAVDKNKVFLRFDSASACGSCSANSGCSHFLLSKRNDDESLALLLTGLIVSSELTPGSKQTLCVREDAMVKVALWCYGFPLLILLMVAAITSALAVNEFVSVVASLSMLVCSFWWLRKFLARRGDQWSLVLQQVDSTACSSSGVG